MEQTWSRVHVNIFITFTYSFIEHHILRKPTTSVFASLQCQNKLESSHPLLWRVNCAMESWGGRPAIMLLWWFIWTIKETLWDTYPLWEKNECMVHRKSLGIPLSTTILYNQSHWKTMTTLPRQSYKCPGPWRIV